MALSTTVRTSEYTVGRNGLIAQTPGTQVEKELQVEICYGQNGWLNVTVRAENAYKVHAESYGYNYQQKRWSYNRVPPAIIVQAVNQLRAEARAARQAAAAK